MAFVHTSSFIPSRQPTIQFTSPRRPASSSIRCSVKPLFDRVVVRVDENESQTAGGLILTTSEETNSQRTGTIVSVGPGRYSPQGELEQIDLVPGDRIVWSNEFGSEPVDAPVEEGKLMCLKVYSIVAKI